MQNITFATNHFDAKIFLLELFQFQQGDPDLTIRQIKPVLWITLYCMQSCPPCLFVWMSIYLWQMHSRTGDACSVHDLVMLLSCWKFCCWALSSELLALSWLALLLTLWNLYIFVQKRCKCSIRILLFFAKKKWPDLRFLMKPY